MTAGVTRESTRSSKCCVRVGAGESPPALADDHGIGTQGDLVHQEVVEQPADHVAAAVYLQLASRLGVQLADGSPELLGVDGPQ
jgi:hypothetical protein